MEGTGSLPRPIGIGLVSVGWMGRVHSQSYSRVNYHYPELDLRPQLVIAADNVSERARFAVDELGYREATADWREVIEHPEVEAVSITAPNYLHREIAVAAAEHGKHLWVEKPVGRNIEETAAIEAAASAAGVMTAVGFNYRHPPAVQHARELIRSGEIGKVQHARGLFLNDHASDPRVTLSWRFQRDLGGHGVIGDLMSHTIDLLQYLVGPVTEVTSLATTVIHERPIAAQASDHFALVEGGEMGPVENEDYAAALVRFGNGAVGSSEVSRITVGPRCQIGFDIFCSDGAVSWDFERMNELQVCLGKSGRDHGYRKVLTGPGHGDYAHFQPGAAIAMSYDDLKVIEAKLFLESIATGSQVGASVADAKSTALVLDAIARAARSGSWQKVGA